MPCRVVNYRWLPPDVLPHQVVNCQRPTRLGNYACRMGGRFTKVDAVLAYGTWLRSPAGAETRAYIREHVPPSSILGCTCVDRKGNGPCHARFIADFVDAGYPEPAPEPEHDALTMCDRKHVYRTPGEASRIAALRRSSGAPPLRVYHCPVCGMYHLTKATTWQPGLGGGG